MVEIKFPGLAIPAFRLTRGQLLNVNVLGVGLVIPPVDITFWPQTTILEPFTLFKTEDITAALLAPINAIPQAVWNLATTILEQQIKEFYEKHPEARRK